MFEQSIVGSHPANKRWTLAVSLAFQATILAILALIPLIYTDRLPSWTRWAERLAAPLPPAPAAPHVTTTQRRMKPDAFVVPVFRAPARIPDRVVQVYDRRSTAIEPAYICVGVPRGFCATPRMSTLLEALARPVPKPPENAVQQ